MILDPWCVYLVTSGLFLELVTPAGGTSSPPFSPTRDSCQGGWGSGASKQASREEERKKMLGLAWLVEIASGRHSIDAAKRHTRLRARWRRKGSVIVTLCARARARSLSRVVVAGGRGKRGVAALELRKYTVPPYQARKMPGVCSPAKRKRLACLSTSSAPALPSTFHSFFDTVTFHVFIHAHVPSRKVQTVRQVQGGRDMRPSDQIRSVVLKHAPASRRQRTASGGQNEEKKERKKKKKKGRKERGQGTGVRRSPFAMLIEGRLWHAGSGRNRPDQASQRERGVPGRVAIPRLAAGSTRSQSGRQG